MTKYEPQRYAEEIKMICILSSALLYAGTAVKISFSVTLIYNQL
jgi:hypothetical protein